MRCSFTEYSSLEDAGRDEAVEVALDLGGDVAAVAENAELDVLVVGGPGHVGAGEQDVVAVDDDGFGVELGVGGFGVSSGQW
jgi:hypothetical protein